MKMKSPCEKKSDGVYTYKILKSEKKMSVYIRKISFLVIISVNLPCLSAGGVRRESWLVTSSWLGLCLSSRREGYEGNMSLNIKWLS